SSAAIRRRRSRRAMLDRMTRGTLSIAWVALIVWSGGLGACTEAVEAPDAGPPDAGRDGGPGRRDAGPPSVDASFDRLTGDVRHPLDDLLRLNHLQAEGTHNSYHLRVREDTLDDWSYD